MERCGIEERLLRRVARELAEASAPLVIAGASVVQTNSLQAVAAGSALNVLLGNVGKPGGVMPAGGWFRRAVAGNAARLPESPGAARECRSRAARRRKPGLHSPAVASLLAKAKAVISFSPVVDDSSAYADLILPDHAALESAALIQTRSCTGIFDQRLARLRAAALRNASDGRGACRTGSKAR